MDPAQSLVSRRPLVLCALLAGIAIACGGWSSLMMGEPTTKSVARSDIAGVYSYQMMTRTVTVELDATGLFTITGSASLSGHGQWSINDQKWIVFAYVDRQTDKEFGWVPDASSRPLDKR